MSNRFTVVIVICLVFTYFYTDLNTLLLDIRCQFS